MNKKIVSELAIGIILLVAIAVGFVFVRRAHAPLQTQQNAAQRIATQTAATPGKIQLDQFYSKDQNGVYYQYDKDSEIKAVENADQNTFQVLGDEYAKDKNNVYYQMQNLGYDAASFEVLGQGWAKDKNSAYFDGSVLDESDPATFSVINEYWAKDKNNFYNLNEKVEGVDAVTFQVVGDNFSKDKNSVYSGYNQKLKLDPGTFKVFGDKYLEDKKGVWYLRAGQAEYTLLNIAGADSGSFQAIGTDLGIDKNHAYFEDKMINGADLATFKLITNDVGVAAGGSATDKNNSYECFDSDCSFGCKITDLKTGQVSKNSKYRNDC